MGVVVTCGLLLLLGTSVAVRWSGSSIVAPTGGHRVRRCLWWIELGLLTVVASGVTVAGAGGRLAMRLLGATAGDRAQGRLTEANEVVGEITVGGTIGFIIFVGLGAGVFTTLAWFVVRRLLPGGRLGALAFGAGVFIVLGTRNEPLRPDNRDFDLLGPWWLALVVFAALALLQGLAVAGFAAACSRWLPLPGRNLRSISYVLLLLLILLAPLGVLALVVIAAVAWAPAAVGRAHEWLHSRRGITVARVVLALAVAVATPGFVADVADIVGRGPS